jgi:hypothetical protein
MGPGAPKSQPPSQTSVRATHPTTIAVQCLSRHGAPPARWSHCRPVQRQTGSTRRGTRSLPEPSLAPGAGPSIPMPSNKVAAAVGTRGEGRSNGPASPGRANGARGPDAERPTRLADTARCLALQRRQRLEVLLGTELVGRSLAHRFHCGVPTAWAILFHGPSQSLGSNSEPQGALCAPKESRDS